MRETSSSILSSNKDIFRNSKMDFHLEHSLNDKQGYSKTELATLLGVLEDDLRKQRDKMNMSIVIEDRKMKTFETKQLEMNEKVEGFVDRVTSQLE